MSFDPFGYIQIGPLPVHVISVAIMGIFFLASFLRLKRIPFLWRVSIAGAFMLFGQQVYEACYLFGIGHPPQLYVLSSAGLFLAIGVLNLKYRFLRIEKVSRTFLVLVCLQVVILLYQYQTGWFYKESMWMDGLIPDPIDWIWSVSKMLGNFMWLPLIGRREKK
jgi:hypothetical protein